MIPQSWKQLRLRPKTALKWLLGLAGIYIVLFTFVWSMAIELLLSGAFKVVHFTTPEDKLPSFRPYLSQQPAFRAVCDFGHWVADITQPMVSDAVLIAHWEKHHKEWETLLDKKPSAATLTCSSRHAIAQPAPQWVSHFQQKCWPCPSCREAENSGTCAQR